MAEAPRRRGGETREQILDVAERAVLEKGFASTSIEELIAAVGITKSGFFYHFKDKGTLAEALLQRYIDRENRLFDDLFDRADELNEDPLHGFLVGLKMLAEMMNDLPGMHPGCLVAAYTYQDQLFNKQVRDMNAAGVLGWRRRFRQHLERISESYPPRADVDFDALADMLSALVDGSITLSRATKDKAVIGKQIMLYRDYVRGVFLGA